MPNFKIAFKVTAEDSAAESLSYSLTIRAASIIGVFSKINDVMEKIARPFDDTEPKPKTEQTKGKDE